MEGAPLQPSPAGMTGVNDTSESACRDFSSRGLEESRHWDYHPDVPVRRRCGVRVLVRKGGKLQEQWLPCKQRSCTLCIENIVGAKMEPMLGDTLYAVTVTKQEWQGLLRKLQRLNKAGEYAPATRIPVSDTHVLVVSAYEIGHEIDPLHVELAMRDADPAWGNITQSGDWKPVKEAKPVAPSETVFYGIVTADQAVLEAATEALGLYTHESHDGLHWYVTPDQCAEIVRIAKCMSHGDYWGERRGSPLLTPTEWAHLTHA